MSTPQFSIGDRVEVRENEGVTIGGKDVSGFLFSGTVTALDVAGGQIAVRDDEEGEIFHCRPDELRRITPPPQDSPHHARIIREESARTFARLQRHPALQPETIAAHYLAMMNTALHLQKLIDFQRQSREPSSESDRIIQAMTAQIAEAHRKDFGIDLDWSSFPTSAAQH